MSIRLSQSALLFAWAVLLLVIAYNNIVDYGSNFAFVQHVLSMDTVFPDSTLKSRALTKSTVHHVGYCMIILWELVAGLSCAVGALILLRHRRAEPSHYEAAKSIATIGLTCAFLLWIIAFLTIGGEWFAMWQSTTWNGQNAAFRMITINGILLLFITSQERS